MSQLGIGVMIQMLGGNEDTVKAVSASLGKKIVAVRLDKERDRVEIDLADHTQLTLWDGGQSCCESRYITTDDDLTKITNTALRDIELADAPPITAEYEEHEVQFLHIRTPKGTATFETHNEHNGYYGGFSIQASLGRWKEQ